MALSAAVFGVLFKHLILKNQLLVPLPLLLLSLNLAKLVDVLV